MTAFTTKKICPALPKDCDSATCDNGCGARCRHFLVAPLSCLHFVGFRDERYWSAVKAFGLPDFYHRKWDARAKAEIMPGDVAVFAVGSEYDPVSLYGWDDSHEDIIARGGDRDR